jgi:hypothetical protein
VLVFRSFEREAKQGQESKNRRENSVVVAADAVAVDRIQKVYLVQTLTLLQRDELGLQDSREGRKDLDPRRDLPKGCRTD